MLNQNYALLQQDTENSNTQNEGGSSQEEVMGLGFSYAVRQIVYEQLENDDDVNFKILIKAPRDEFSRSIRYGRYKYQDRKLYFTIKRTSELSSKKQYGWDTFNTQISSLQQANRCLYQLAEGIVSTKQQTNVRTVKVRVNLGKLLFRQEDPEKKVARILNSKRDFGLLCRNLNLTDEDRNVTTQFCTCIPDNLPEKINKFLIEQLGFWKAENQQIINIYTSLRGDFGGQSYVCSFFRNEYDDGFVNYELRKTRLGYRKKWFLTFMQDADLVDARFKICEDRRLQPNDIPNSIQQFQKDCCKCLNEREYKNVHGAVYNYTDTKNVYINTSRKKCKKLFYGKLCGLPFKISLTKMEVDSHKNLQYEVSIWSRDMDDILLAKIDQKDQIHQIEKRLELMHSLYQKIARC